VTRLSAEQQEADLKLKETIATAMLDVPPSVGDLEAGKQFIEVSGAVTSADSPAELKQNMMTANANMLGVDLSSTFTSASRRRRRRSVSGSSGVDPDNIVANPDVALAKSQINLQFGMTSATTYSTEALAQKVALFQLLDTYSIGLCKTMVIGQSHIDIVATAATMRTVQLDMKDETSVTRALGCASSDSGCSSTVQSPPFTLKATGVNHKVCLASTTMVGDMHSTSEPTDTALSNIVRIRMWNATAEIKPTSANVNITIFSNANTTKSYKCMIWDETNKQWTNTSITTMNPSGELDESTLKYHVTCNTTQLGDVMLVEGPEIIIITEAPTTTRPPTTTTQPTTKISTTKKLTTTKKPDTTTKKPDTSTKKGDTSTKKPDSSTKKSDSTTKQSESSTTAQQATTKTDAPSTTKVQTTTVITTTEAATTTPMTPTTPTTAPTTQAEVTTRLTTTEATTNQPEIMTTGAADLTVHPDDLDLVVSFVLHAGNCSHAFNEQTKDENTQSAQHQVAKLLEIPHASMQSTELNCTAAGDDTIATLEEYVKMT
jgi:hypothetical protein